MRAYYREEKGKCKITFSFAKEPWEYSIGFISLSATMATILDLANIQRERAVRQLTDTAWSLGEVLANPPASVARILWVPKNELVTLTNEELEQYVFHEIFVRTRSWKKITPEYILTLQYIAKNIANVYASEKSDYVQDAMEEWDYKRAWDNAVYGYIHFVGKRNNPLSPEDYIHLAVQCYLRWHERQPQSMGYIVAREVPSILPFLQNWRNDMMQRVPSFHVIAH